MKFVNITGLRRHTRRPRRYQEDTEEEEDISRGIGRPRGFKGRHRSSDAFSVSFPSPARCKRLTRRMAASQGRQKRSSRSLILMPATNIVEERPLRATRMRCRGAYVDATDTETEQYSVRPTRRRGRSAVVQQKQEEDEAEGEDAEEEEEEGDNEDSPEYDESKPRSPAKAVEAEEHDSSKGKFMNL